MSPEKCVCVFVFVCGCLFVSSREDQAKARLTAIFSARKHTFNVCICIHQSSDSLFVWGAGLCDDVKRKVPEIVRAFEVLFLRAAPLNQEIQHLVRLVPRSHVQYLRGRRM